MRLCADELSREAIIVGQIDGNSKKPKTNLL